MPGTFQVRTGCWVEGMVGRPKQAVGGVQDEDTIGLLGKWLRNLFTKLHYFWQPSFWKGGW